MTTHPDWSPPRKSRTSAGAGTIVSRHQTQNLFATLRSIVSLSAADNPAVESFAMHLMGRVDAISRVHAKVARNSMGFVDLEELLADEMIAQSGLEATDLSGPPIRLPARTAEVLGLALHELAVNALKFGALAYDGSVAIQWRRLTDATPPKLEIRWLERGVLAMNTRPQKRGFGLTLIEEALAYEIEGDGAITFTPRGVECLIHIPLMSLQAGD